MEALWKFEANLLTQEAVLLFVFTAALVIGLCTVTAIRNRVKRNRIVNQDGGLQVVDPPESECTRRSLARWGSAKKVLMGSVRWSKASKWEENLSRSRKEQPMPLLVRGVRGEVGWQSHNSASHVWQRPILMGEKCELPRYSGLILYDERGLPLDPGHPDKEIMDCQENAMARTTLRDLL